ncbi:helix-turn-helix transcriptional regulator [Ralstonia pseudosolanacearum]
MTPDEFIFKLKNLPPDTTLTPNHLIAVLETISHSISKGEDDIDSYPDSKLISEEALAEWIDESISTLQKWRVSGKGPKFIKKPKNIAYRVGDVRDWLDNLTVASTAESHVRLHRLEGIFDGDFFKPTPLMICSTQAEPLPFFDSLIVPPEVMEGFVLEYVEYYSAPEENLASWLYNNMAASSLTDLHQPTKRALANGADPNKKAKRVIGDNLMEFGVADLLANFKGSDFGFGELVYLFLDNGLDVSEVKDASEQFIRTFNAHLLHNKLEATLPRKS